MINKSGTVIRVIIDWLNSKNMDEDVLMISGDQTFKGIYYSDNYPNMNWKLNRSKIRRPKNSSTLADNFVSNKGVFYYGANPY